MFYLIGWFYIVNAFAYMSKRWLHKNKHQPHSIPAFKMFLLRISSVVIITFFFVLIAFRAHNDALFSLLTDLVSYILQSDRLKIDSKILKLHSIQEFIDFLRLTLYKKIVWRKWKDYNILLFFFNFSWNTGWYTDQSNGIAINIICQYQWMLDILLRSTMKKKI